MVTSMTTATAPAPAEVRVDEALVRTLLTSQFPEAAGLALGQRHEGRDAIVWRLGDAWAVRLPRRQLAADRHVTELDWLPRIGTAWPFRAPVPVRVGAPTQSFPWRWSIAPWVPGVPSSLAPLSPVGARELGAALAALHVIAPAQAPRHPTRSRSLAARAARFEDRLHTLHRRTEGTGWRVEVAAAQRVFHEGAAVTRPVPTWTHLDLRNAHVLTHEGRLAGIIDWGDAAAGDPASDIGQALAMLPASHWDALVEGLGGVDLPTFLRARAEAVEFAAALALSADATDATAGWSALQALGVAQRAS